MKIKKVILDNYRGYKHQEFNFTDGLNTLVGSGNSGKSAALKAILFVLRNEQSGNIESDWIMEDKKKIKKGETCCVEIHTDKGDIVKRVKSRTENFYQINDNAPIKNLPRTGTPSDITALFNINDINIQLQLDSHYMLSETASQVSKTLNRMMGLEIIDESVSNVKTLMRRTKKVYEASNDNTKKYEQELSKFNFLEDMGKDVEALDSIKTDKDVASKKFDQLSLIKSNIESYTDDLTEIKTVILHKTKVGGILEDYDEVKDLQDDIAELKFIQTSITTIQNDLSTINDIIQHKDLVKDCIELLNQESAKQKTYDRLADIEDSIKGLKKEIRISDRIIANKDLCNDLTTSYTNLSTIKNKIVIVRGLKDSIHNLQNDIESYTKEIVEAKDSIKGQACPVCGQMITDLKEAH